MTPQGDTTKEEGERQRKTTTILDSPPPRFMKVTLMQLLMAIKLHRGSLCVITKDILLLLFEGDAINVILALNGLKQFLKWQGKHLIWLGMNFV